MGVDPCLLYPDSPLLYPDTPIMYPDGLCPPAPVNPGLDSWLPTVVSAYLDMKKTYGKPDPDRDALYALYYAT